jgi:hypothetical protein
MLQIWMSAWEKKKKECRAHLLLFVMMSIYFTPTLVWIQELARLDETRSASTLSWPS